MLKISIVDGHHAAQTRNTKNGARYFQFAYADMGGAFPQEIEIPIRNPAEAKPIGEYSLALSTFQVGRYKNLELNPFQLDLVPFSKAASMQKAG